MKMLWKLTDNIKYEDCEVRGSSLICLIYYYYCYFQYLLRNYFRDLM